MNLKPNTPTEILRTMREEMPFELNNRINPYIIEAMHLYASEKVKEALQLAAERAEAFNDTYAPVVSRKSILSLETELVNNIKNEK